MGLSVGRTVMANYLNFPMVPSPVQAGESQLSFPSSSHIHRALSDLLFLGFLWLVASPGFQDSALPWLPSSYLYPGSSSAGLRALLCLHSCCGFTPSNLVQSDPPASLHAHPGLRMPRLGLRSTLLSRAPESTGKPHLDLTLNTLGNRAH